MKPRNCQNMDGASRSTPQGLVCHSGILGGKFFQNSTIAVIEIMKHIRTILFDKEKIQFLLILSYLVLRLVKKCLIDNLFIMFCYCSVLSSSASFLIYEIE